MPPLLFSSPGADAISLVHGEQVCTLFTSEKHEGGEKLSLISSGYVVSLPQTKSFIQHWIGSPVQFFLLHVIVTPPADTDLPDNTKPFPEKQPLQDFCVLYSLPGTHVS